ncbi:MAG: hypothetical protein NTW82_02075 [Bacteroidia bacterium]|nr:hypothetical protein [Bacteroidia bacterium]
MAKTGSDAGNGSVQDPFLTIEKAVSVVLGMEELRRRLRWIPDEEQMLIEMISG